VSRFWQIVIYCVAAVVFAAVALVPRWLAEQAKQSAVRDAVTQSVQDSIRQAADAAAHDAATRIADQIVHDDQAKSAHPATPAPGSASPVTAAPKPVIVDRKTYTIAFPPGSTIDPPDPEVDLEHLTTVSLPSGGGSVDIVGIEDKSMANFDRMFDGLQSKLDSPVIIPTDTFSVSNPAPVHTQAVRGTVRGSAVIFEVAEFDGKTRACYFIAEYPADKAKQSMELIQRCLRTLAIKG
jgi:hypothetical protein